MKILVDEMPVFPDECWFSDRTWDHEKHIWKACCTLGPDGCTDCDLTCRECSKMKTLSGVSLT